MLASGKFQARLILPAREWSTIGLTVLCYAAAAGLGLFFTRDGAYVAALWPANGILCAILLRFVPVRNHNLTLVLSGIGVFAVNSISGTPEAVSAVFGVINVLEAAFAVRLIRRMGAEYPDFTNVSFLMKFVAYVGLCIPLAGGIAGAIAVLAFKGHAVQPAFFNWFLSEAIGFLVCVPALSLIWSREPLNTFKRSRQEIAALFALLLFAAVGVFAQTSHALMFVLLPVLVLLAYRLGPPMAALATVILSVVVVAFTLHSIGPAALAEGDALGSRIHLVQMFMLFVFFTSLPVATTVVEQERLKADLVEKERQASRANAELRNNNDRLEREIGERNRAEQETARMYRRLDAALENMSQGLCMYDARGNVIVSNERFASMYGLTPEDIRPGATRRQVVEGRIRAGNIPVGEVAAYLMEHAGLVGEPCDTVHELADGRVISVVRRPMKEGGWVSTHEDITERRRIESRLVHLALHDGLTDLPNRVMFRRRLEQALGRVRRGEQLAVHFLDLDHFKCLNDTLGHEVGDELLKSVARKLQDCVRGIDTVARLGGDEFAVLQVQLSDVADATAMAQRILDTVAVPQHLLAHHVGAPASIGITVAPDDGLNPDDLMKQADLALYKAKADGRGTYKLFEPEMDARMKGRRQLEVDLRRGLHNDEFEVYYQPIHDLETDKVASLEALLRWRHPVRGTVSPAEFIPVAEEIGLIGALGELVLERACTAAKKFPPDTKVAINLSAAQFYDIGLAQKIAATLEACELEPNRLEVEITESLLLSDDQHTLTTLHQLRSLGISIALDDFGTGYSSLGYLQRFPFDKIKIDRSFIKDVTAEGESLTLLRAITGLARALDMTTTAEGIETEQQLACVRSVGCTEVQGFLFCRPMPEMELAEMFANVRNAAGDGAERVFAEDGPAEREAVYVETAVAVTGTEGAAEPAFAAA